MNNNGHGDRPDWDEPTDPGLRQQRGYSPRYGQEPRQEQTAERYGQQRYGRQGVAGPQSVPRRGPRPTAYDDAFGPEPNHNRKRTIIAVGSAVAVVVVLVTVGLVLLQPGSKPGRADAAGQGPGDGSASPTPTLDPTTTAPPTTTPPPPTTTTSRRVVLPKPTVTVKPPAKEVPPPPPPPDPTCTAPTYHGTAATQAQVKAALVAGGSQEYWKGVQLDPNLTVPLPTITIPANLMKAIAWQESGWQSNIESCDHGIGVMQVMQPTADSTNLRFATNFDINTLAGNTQLGAEYLERLIMYFGIYHFSQHFALDTVAQVGPHNEQYSLLQVVVAAYNVGVGGVESGNDIVIGPIGTQYSNNVIALMSNCVCLGY